MKKRTHFALSRHLLKDTNNDLSKVDSMLFCFGSIFPDMTPLCLLHPHKFNITDKASKKRLNKVLFGEHNHFANSFRLGCVSHHLADYFTAPHNRTGVKGFCMDHRGYEMKFDAFFKNKLENLNTEEMKNDIESREFWQHVNRCHEEYMDANESFTNDYSYIIEMISNLFFLSQKKRQFCAA
ncbi:MAG: zinc dependent phospholipase C family protein [Lachnospiraceae bacterium]